jgi:phenylacetate-CoA ligase
MIHSAFIRRLGFWGIDFVKGSPVAHHIKDLKRAFADPRRGRELAQARLEKFLDYACATTPFYKKFAGARDVCEFPVIQKSTIKDNYDDFLSSAYKKNNLASVLTSGSYGMPFEFYLTKDKRARQQAEVIYFNAWAGYEVGMRYLQTRSHATGRLRRFIQNGVVVDPSVINEGWLEKHRQVLKNGGIEFISGAYPSAVAPIAKYCRSKGDPLGDFVLKGITICAEPLVDSDRETIEGVFGCIVLDRYCADELGVMSHECLKCKRHHINLASYKIELLRIDRDEPVEPGEVGRVVVTDLFSHAMPLIRYDTGDLTAWSEKACPCGMNVPTFEKIHGRTIEMVYDPSGKVIIPFVITWLFKDLFSSVIQYQFVQETRDSYLIRLHVMEGFDGENILREQLQKELGPDAHLSFEYVDSIPPLPSGKRPYIVNEFLKSQNSMS